MIRILARRDFSTDRSPAKTGRTSKRGNKTQGIGRGRIALALTFAAATPAGAQPPGLTCETSGDRRHCFDHHGYLSTEERSGAYVHGWDSEGRAWTTWEHDGRSETWRTR
jgi:hypothetical protein